MPQGFVRPRPHWFFGRSRVHGPSIRPAVFIAAPAWASTSAPSRLGRVHQRGGVLPSAAPWHQSVILMRNLRDTAVVPFPTGWLTGALVCSGLMLLGLIWTSWVAYRDIDTVQRSNLRSLELRGIILHLDEVLTMSARMAAITGNAKWEERYRQFEGKLDGAVKEAMALTSGLANAEAAAQTGAANLKLVEMENNSFALVRDGKPDEARTLLFSEDYEVQKNIYAAGMATFMGQLQDQVAASLRQKRRDAVLSLVMVGGLLGLWVAVGKRLKNWREAEMRNVAALARAEAELHEAHDNLERRVAERTGELVQEVSERKKVTEKLEASHSSLAAINALLDRSFLLEMTDLEGRITHANDNFCALSGYSREELIGQSHRMLRSGLHPDELYNEIWRTVARGEIWRGELNSRAKDGHTYWVDTTIGPMHDAQGKIRGYLAIRADITERKQAEAELRRSKAFVDSVIKHLPVAVFIKEAQELRFVLWNKAGEQLTGYSNEEMIGKNDHDFFPAADADKFAAIDREVLRGMKRLDVPEEKLETRHNGTRILAVAKVPILNAEGRPEFLLGIAQDITERKQTEEKMAEMTGRLIETSRLAGMAEVATGVLHNVGNVLNSVNVSATVVMDAVRKSRGTNLAKVAALLREHEADLGTFITTDPKGRQVPAFLGLLAENLGTERTTILHELEQLQKNLQHIKDVVSMQQSYAKVSGVTETVKLDELLADTLEMNAGSFQRHDVEVVREFEMVPPVSTDKHKLLQILVNLVRNAKQACDESGRADKRITLRLAAAAGCVRVSVADNGVGIPRENLGRVFNHGFTTKKTGHGFGLHSSANAIKEMGGTLTVHSDGPGLGTTFTVELPLNPSAGAPIA
ncbi:MAG: PAS domain S-box protein [Opitutaceae bacterium]|nr:PAS domain S-box protein [Opitutaceae bacterium]